MLKKKIFITSNFKLHNLRNFNEIFRDNVTYDNIKSHQKPGLQPFSENTFLEKKSQRESNWLPFFEKYIFEKKTHRGCEIDFLHLPAFLGLRNVESCIDFFKNRTSIYIEQ